MTIADLVVDMRAPTPTGAAEMATPRLAEIQSHCLRQRQQPDLSDQSRKRLQRQRYAAADRESGFPGSDGALSVSLPAGSQQLALTEYQSADPGGQRTRLNQLSAVLLNQTASAGSSSAAAIRTVTAESNHHEKQQLMLRQRPVRKRSISLDAYSPLKILGRGYGRSPQNGHLVRSIQEVSIHEELRIRLHDGQIKALVKEKEEQV